MLTTSGKRLRKSKMRSLLTSYILSELDRPAEACARLEEIADSHQAMMQPHDARWSNFEFLALFERVY